MSYDSTIIVSCKSDAADNMLSLLGKVYSCQHVQGVNNISGEGIHTIYDSDISKDGQRLPQKVRSYDSDLNHIVIR